MVILLSVLFSTVENGFFIAEILNAFAVQTKRFFIIPPHGLLTGAFNELETCRNRETVVAKQPRVLGRHYRSLADVEH